MFYATLILLSVLMKEDIVTHHLPKRFLNLAVVFGLIFTLSNTSNGQSAEDAVEINHSKLLVQKIENEPAFKKRKAAIKRTIEQIQTICQARLRYRPWSLAQSMYGETDEKRIRQEANVFYQNRRSQEFGQGVNNDQE